VKQIFARLRCILWNGRLGWLWLLAGFNLAWLIQVVLYTSQNGYLPAPFVYDKSDTFMDLFHPMYWSDDPGVYIRWGSVYPPIIFLILQPLKFFVAAGRDVLDAFELRGSGGSLLIALIPVYLLLPLLVLSTRIWRSFSLAVLVPTYLSVVTAAPMLFAVERGNVILLCLPMLAFCLSAEGALCFVAIGLLINLKPYFAVFIVAFLLSRRWADALFVTLAAGAIYVGSGMLLDASFPWFVGNLLSFSQNDQLFSVREMLSMPSSVSALAAALRTYAAQSGGGGILGFDAVVVADTVEIIKWFAILTAFGVLAYVRNVPRNTILALGVVIISNLGTWVGGYSVILYIPLVPILLRMNRAYLYLVALVVLFLPLDAVGLVAQNIGARYSYVSDAVVTVNWTLGLGAVLRPSINLALLAALSYEIFERHLFSRDAPVIGKQHAPGRL